MSEELGQATIVRAVADSAARRGARKVIRALQRMTHTLSGDDSGLTTTWDEVCVQVQDEESFAWVVYDEIVRGLVEGFAADLPKHEREAIWLQTDAGIDWEIEADSNHAGYPICDDNIVDYLLKEYVYAEAADWSNARIRAFIDRSRD